MGTFTRDWTLAESQPTNLTEAHQIDDYLRYRAVDVAERLKAMFYGFTGGETTYEASVKFLNLKDQITVDVPSVGYSRFYTKNVTGKSEIFAQNDDGTEVQLTSAGKLNWSALTVPLNSINQTHIELANNSHLVAKNAAATADVNLIKANASDKSELPDGSQLATSGAPTVDAMIANKKYVDDRVKKYDSGWFAVGQDTTYTKAHGLGVVPFMVQVYYSDTSDGSGDVVQLGTPDVSNAGDRNGAVVVDLTVTNVVVRAGHYVVLYTDAGGTARSYTSGYLKIVALTV